MNRSRGSDLIDGSEPLSSYSVGDLHIDLHEVEEPSIADYLLPGRRSGDIVGEVNIDQEADDLDLYVWTDSTELEQVENSLAEASDSLFSYD